MKAAFRWISLTAALTLVTSSIFHVEATSLEPRDAAKSGETPLGVNRADEDPCVLATVLGSPISLDLIKNCLNANFPFPDDHRARTAESVIGAIEAGFVFEDLAANPPSGGVTQGLSLKQAPVVETIRALAADTSLTLREFHDGISKAFIQARDAHFAYDATCFRQFLFHHGLVLGDVQDPDSGERSIKVMLILNGFDQLTDMVDCPVGCDVVSINGRPAADFVQAWADSDLDFSKDANVRYTASLSSPQWINGIDGAITGGRFALRYRLPDEASLRYGFSCPRLWGSTDVREFDFAWGGVFLDIREHGLTTDEYYQRFCVDPTVVGSTNTTTGTVPEVLMTASSSDKAKAERSKEQKDELNRMVQSTPWDFLPEDIREWAIDNLLQEFKELPGRLARRTEDMITGHIDGPPSKLEWADESHPDELRARARQMLEKMPLVQPVPPIPLFQQKELDQMVKERLGKPDMRTKKKAEFNSTAALGYTVLMRGSAGIEAILLDDEITGVITIPTFIPGTTTSSFFSAYTSLIEAIDALRPMAEHLILDVTRNYGGYLCLSRGFIEVFFPDMPLEISNIRFSEVEQRLIDADYGYYSYYLTTPELEETTPEYLLQPRSHENRQYNFTNYLTDDCDFGFSGLTVDPEEEAKRPRSVKKGYVYDPNATYYPWDPEDMMILSDGTCGSACAMFANQLVEKKEVRSVVVGGGRNGNPMSYSSFPGSQVVQASEQYFMKQQVLEQSTASGGRAAAQQKQQTPLEKRHDDLEEEEKPVSGSSAEADESWIKAATASLKQLRTGVVNRITARQRDELLEVLPKPLQNKATFSLTYRQLYNTGQTTDLFVQDDQGEWQPNWSPVAQWNEYSFLPARTRISLKLDHFFQAALIWEDARDATW